MTNNLPATERSIAFVLLGAVGAWLAARYGWPLCGPLLLDPCPLPTEAGCWAAMVLGGLWGGTKAWELRQAERRRQRHSLERYRRRSAV